jgi:hypothetical protein
MRELVTSVFVSTYTLQSTPYTGERSEKANDAQLRRTALRRVLPVVCI